jgi:biotin carboxyl carrier protein
MQKTGGAAGDTSIEIEGSDELKVLSPQTGTFYLAASPSEPPYASAGDRISAQQTLCQIEAMKLFTSISLSSFNGANEIYAEGRSYDLVRVNQVNGAQVNAGDLLFIIRPVDA